MEILLFILMFASNLVFFVIWFNQFRNEFKAFLRSRIFNFYKYLYLCNKPHKLVDDEIDFQRRDALEDKMDALEGAKLSKSKDVNSRNEESHK
jgi:hypothetical protein